MNFHLTVSSKLCPYLLMRVLLPTILPASRSDILVLISFGFTMSLPLSMSICKHLCFLSLGLGSSQSLGLLLPCLPLHLFFGNQSAGVGHLNTPLGDLPQNLVIKILKNSRKSVTVLSFIFFFKSLKFPY